MLAPLWRTPADARIMLSRHEGITKKKNFLAQASSLEPLSKLLFRSEIVRRSKRRRRRTLGGALTAFLQNGQQGGPTRCADKLESFVKIMRTGNTAEKGFFVLQNC